MSSTPLAPRVAVTLLYADAVQSILAFLPMSDLVATARCSRQWLAWAVSTHSPRQWAVIKSAEVYSISPPAHARSLRHHVRTLNCTAPVSDFEQFLLFLRSFPQLQRVQVVVAEDVMTSALAALTVGEGALRLPATLLEFRVLIQIPQFTESHTQFLQLIVRLAATAPLLHTFAWRNVLAYVSSYGELDFGPLLTLAHLTDLALQFSPNSPQMAQLSNLPAIRRLRFPPISNLHGSYNDTIDSFGQHAGQLSHLEWLQIDVACNDRNIDALAKIASLTRLPSRFIEDSGLLRLPTLTQALRRFDFEFDRSDDPDEVHPNPIAVLLQCSFLSTLEHLSLARLSLFDFAENEQLASLLPRLRILQLSEAWSLSSLSFLQQLPLLEQLALSHTHRACSWDNFAHVLALPRLRRFHSMLGFRDVDVSALQLDLANPVSIVARFDCFDFAHQRPDGHWIFLKSLRSHCSRRGEFDLNPNKLECWCELEL